MKRRIVLVGPPASGKGSQANRIHEKHGIPAVSTGHLLRDEAKAGTELGRLAAEHTSKGHLAPDELVIAVVEKWLDGGREAFVLDGFPRTLLQAVRLESFLKKRGTPLDVVFSLDCEVETIEDRILNRMQCPICKSVFNVRTHLGGNHDARCPKCGGHLERRADDTREVLRERLRVYAEKTKPLMSFYAERNLLVRINGNRNADAVFADLDAVLVSNPVVV
ncbi:MAG TPA: nucleoside monophosphate kinase [Chthoniobacterales bacterium]